MGGFSLPVHMYAKWAFICTKVFYSAVETSILYLKTERSPKRGFIDDSYLQGRDTNERLLNISDTHTLFFSLGFVINVQKSPVIPAEQITFL